MPSLPERVENEHPDGASIRVDFADPADTAVRAPPSKPTLILGMVEAWIDSTTNSAIALDASRKIAADIDLELRVARIAASPEARAADLTSTLTIVAALLLLRVGRTAVHAAAVVPPESAEAWLLLGDSHSGKSTATANLVKAGWSYLSDDYIVLSRGADETIVLEGWPDDFHIDEGWQAGKPTGVRGTLPELGLRTGARVSTATLKGVLFTRISANEPTRISTIDAIVALERIIRQSPWLVADKKTASTVLDLLSATACLPAAELRLGIDTFGDAQLLARILSDYAAQLEREPSQPSGEFGEA